MRVGINVLAFTMAAVAATAQPIVSKVGTLPPGPKVSTVGTVYTKSFFQERYMQVGKAIAYGLFIGGAYQNAVWRATGKYEGKAPVRQEANAFEALLGDFDVTGHTNVRLRSKITEASRFEITFTDDPAVAETIVELASHEVKPTGEEMQKMLAEGRAALCAVKVSYGLGARAGREQIGFKKTYRPFVRLLGLIRSTSNGDALWSGAVIAWGAKGYKGDEADAKKIQREELVEAFKATTESAVALLIRSLNGESLEPMGELVDETKEDGKF